MNFLVGSEGTLGVITEATMQIERLPETRLFNAVLFDDLGKALEAGRRIMTARLQPTVLRLYDPASTTSLIKRVLNMDLQGAYLILGFDGFEEIARAQEKRSLAICAELGLKGTILLTPEGINMFLSGPRGQIAVTPVRATCGLSAISVA